MKKQIIILLLSVIVLYALPLKCQELNGQMGFEGPSLSTRVNVDASRSIIHVTSKIPNLRFDSNRKIEKVINQSSGDWDVLVPPGTHILKIIAENYNLLTLPAFDYQRYKTYDLRVYPVNLPQKFGTVSGKGSLSVDTDPTGSKVTVQDMEGEWTTPKQFKSIKAGTWTLIFTKEKYDTLVAEVFVAKDSLVQPLPYKLVPRYGVLNISTNVDAKLYVDGKPVSISQNKLVEILKGSREIILRKNRYEDFKQVVEVKPGDTLAINAELQAKFGFMQFENFQGIDVWVDSNPTETTGLVEVDAGKRTVRIKHPRLGELTRAFMVASGQTTVLHVDDFEQSGVLNISVDVPADISIDGKVIGKTLASQDLPAGTYKIEVSHPVLGQRSEEVNIQPNQRTSLFMYMLPSRSTAYVLSLIPGASQIYKNQSRGYIYSGLFAVTAGASIYFLMDYTKKNNDYNAAISSYNSATTSTEAAKYRQQVLSLYDGVNNASKMKNTALMAAGAIYVWNIIDALIFTPELGYRGEGKKAVNVGLNPTRDGLKLELSMKF